MIRQLLYLTVALAWVGHLQGQSDNSNAIQRLSGTTMGSVEWNVSVVMPASVSPDELQKEIEAVLSDLNSAMSTWIPESEVSRFNDSDSTDWFPVSIGTATVVHRAQEISAATDGAFDITVKPLVELWNFGAGRGDFQIPPDSEIERLLATTGYTKLECRLEPPALRKTIPALQIDLSGIAKGYAVDLVAAKIRELGINASFVDIGGEVAAQGKKPDGSHWRIGIEKPLDDSRDVEIVVQLVDRCMATSGDYRNFAIVDGRRYSHTISPASGCPIDTGMASVSVVADDCLTADAMATALMVAGPARILPLAEKLGIEVLAMHREPSSEFKRIQSDGFSALVGAMSAPGSSARSSSTMAIMLATLIIVGLAICGLAIGAVFSNKPLQGSCGGMGSSGIDGDCSACGGAVEACPDSKTA